MKIVLFAGLWIFLVGCNVSRLASQLPENISHMASATKLGCRYEKQFVDEQAGKKDTGIWYFWRNGNKVEMRDTLSNQGEIWEKDQHGKLSYSRLFFNEGIALDFTPGDLAALNLTPSWNELNFIIHREELGKSLKLASKSQSQNIEVEHYQGNLKGVATELDWLPALQLPVRIMKKQRQGEFTLMLSQCGETHLSELQPSSATASTHLRRIDFTDLGDMEDDPAVKKLEGLLEAHHD